MTVHADKTADEARAAQEGKCILCIVLPVHVIVTQSTLEVASTSHKYMPGIRGPLEEKPYTLKPLHP